MRNTKIKLLAMSLSASFVLSSVAPSLASASAMDSTTNTNYTQIDPNAVSPETIDSVIKRAEALEKIVKLIPGAQPYAKALDIIINTLKKIDPAKAAKKVQLASKSIDAIKFSIEGMQDKTKKAHVDMGVEITKDVLVLADPYASNQRIDRAIESLKKAEEAAKNSAEITDEDVATIYVKKDLNNTIEEAKKLRRNKGITKEEREEINQAIKKAEHTKNKAKVTVAEIKAATAELQDFIDNFLAGDTPEVPKENELPEVPEVIEEEAEEEASKDSENEDEIEENTEDDLIEVIDPEFSNVDVDEIEASENN